MLRQSAYVCLLCSALIAASFFGAGVTPADPGGMPHVPGEVIIRFKDNASQQEKDQILNELGGTRIKGFGRIKAEHRRLETGMTVDEAISRVQGNPKVQYIEPNFIWTAEEIPNDPQFNQLWGMLNTGQTGGTAGADISATNAWDVFTGSSSVLVGVIDTGVDYTHPDLAGNIWTNPGEIAGNGIDDDLNGYIDDIHGWDFVNNDGDPMDDHGHGSHCSGTIGAEGNNAIGVAGVTWDVRIMGLKFLNASGSGSTADAVEAVEYATMMGVRLTSNSWGGGGFSQALLDAINAANAAGVLFVAAAGNSGVNTDNSPHYPSSYNAPNILSVAATDHNDQLASFSNYGATTVDLAAPGVNILSTFPGNQYGTISGTSMATPHVSGALALVFGRFPAIGHLNAKNLILNFVDPLPNLSGVVLTGGRLNAFFPIADPDSIPPGAVMDLAVTGAGSNWLDIGWTATGDDGPAGTASRYVVKVSPYPIDALNFDEAATVPNPPDPGSAGTPESMRIPGLDFSTTYYVAVKALDEFGNAGSVSNVPSGVTLGAPDIAAAPLSFMETLLTGASSSQSLSLSNVGEGTLDFQIPLPQLITGAPALAEYIEYGKEDVDPRPGILGNGGPDGFGYRWIDSDDPGGPLFDWTDISGTGTAVITTGDDVNQGPFSIGFDFPFYGVTYSTFRVCSNGWLSFNSTATSYANQPLPNSGAPTALVAPFWDDLLPTTSGEVYYENVGGRLIVQWNNVAHYGSGGPYTFQAVLHGDGTLEYHYLSMASPTNSATIGIQNAARTDGLQVVYNGAYVHDNMTVRIGAVPQWVTVTPAEGTIYAPNSSGLTVDFDAAGLLGGTYDANILILSNDPDESPFQIPVQLTVIGAPDIELAPTLIEFGEVFLGATPMDVLQVQNPGTDSLHVSSITVDDPVYNLDATSFVVPPRSGVNVGITFSPVSVGMYPATVTVFSDDPDQPSISMNLTGTGVVPPDFSVTPIELSSSLFTGESEVQMLNLSNAGGADLEWSIGTEFVSASQQYTLTAPEVPTGPDEDGGIASEPPRTSPIQVELDDLTGVNIMWERSHGQTSTSLWSTIIADFTSRGATVTENTGTITPGLLAGFDVVWSADLNQTWDPDELAALAGWMAGGGGLLLEGDNTATVPIYNAMLAAVGSGIEFSLTDGSSGVSTNIHPHETTENVAGVYFTANTASIGAITAPAGPLVDDDTGVPAVAVSQVGAGRIIAAADEIFQNSRMSQADNQLFGNQVMDWLAGTAFLTVEPLSGIVTAGGNQTVSVIFDATGLFGGLYEANVNITTNDPLAPIVAIPAALQVTGAPDLLLDPAAIDFGQVFVGYPELQDYTVTNSGTDVLTITGMTSDNPDFTPDFTGVTLPLQLDPLHAAILRVRFGPSGPGPQTATLSLASNDPDAPTTALSLAGEGVVPPIASVGPTSLHHDLLTGETAVDPVTISNTGPSNLDWSTQLQFLPAIQSYMLTSPVLPTGPDEDGGETGTGTRTTPIQADLADLTGVDIMWDRSHGQSTTSLWTTIIADFTSRGATVTDNLDTITPGLLLAYDVLWTSDHSQSWDPAELDALTDWVNAGGSILLEGDNASTVPNYNAILGALGAGIEFSTTSGASGTTSNIHPHATTQDVTGIYLTANVASIPVVGSPAGPLVDDVDGVTAVAFSQSGAGRIIAASDEIFQNSRMSQASNQLFGNQVMDWLSVPVFLSVDPAEGTVLPGGSQVVNVTFDAGGLFGGDYAGRVRFLTNDPAHGVLDVAATLHVTGVPRIGFSAASVDFGDVFIGYPTEQVLTVTNVGTDHLSVSGILPGLPDYSVSPATIELDPLQSADLTVQFDPTTDGDRSTLLTFTSNDPDSPHTVSLTGFGVVPPVASASPDPVVGAAMPGGSKSKTLTLCNTGGSDLVWSAGSQANTTTQVYEELELPKGQDIPGGEAPPDPRPSIRGTGGPDMFGYTWVDSDEPGGPVFDWVDIRDIGNPTDFPPYDLDGTFGPYPIGFDFPFYENAFDEFYVSSEGWISFTNGELTTYTNQPLPNSGASVPENLLAIWWDDNVYDEADSSYVVYYNDGTRLIIEFHLRRIAQSSPPWLNFEIILYPNGDVVYQYKSFGPTINSATIGWQNATKDDGHTIIHNDGTYAHTNLAILISSGPQWLSVSPESGVIPAGECVELDVLMDAEELEAGDYTGNITVASNDPANPTLTNGVVFHVGTVDASYAHMDPNTLNLGSGGNWVKAVVELPNPYLVSDIVLETVLLEGVVPAASMEIGDDNENGIPDAMLRFDRALLEGLLLEGDQVEVTVTGEVRDIIYFVATDWIRAINPQIHSPNGGEQFLAGQAVLIEWDVPNGWVVDHAAITFSPDGGQTWELAADNLTGASAVWMAPAAPTNQALLRVFLYDETGIIGSDTSDGPFQVLGQSVGVNDLIPGVHRLYQNSPNPFRSSTRIAFDLPEDNPITLRVYDLSGRVIRELSHGTLPAGKHVLSWDGRDSAGREIAAGLYFYELRAGDFVANRRMLLMR